MPVVILQASLESQKLRFLRLQARAYQELHSSLFLQQLVRRQQCVLIRAKQAHDAQVAKLLATQAKEFAATSDMLAKLIKRFKTPNPKQLPEIERELHQVRTN